MGGCEGSFEEAPGAGEGSEVVDALVACLLEEAPGEGAAAAAEAMDEEGAGAVWGDGADVGFEFSERDIDGLAEVVLGELGWGTDIDDEGAFLVPAPGFAWADEAESAEEEKAGDGEGSEEGADPIVHGG